MTHDPEAAERLATMLEVADGCQRNPVACDAAALIRAQAAEIAAHPAALQEARNAERERIAIALDEEANTTPCEEDAKVVRDCARLVRADFSYDAAEALIDTPAPPAESAGDALRLHLQRMLMAHDGVPLNAVEFGRWVDEARAALASEPRA